MGEFHKSRKLATHSNVYLHTVSTEVRTLHSVSMTHFEPDYQCSAYHHSSMIFGYLFLYICNVSMIGQKRPYIRKYVIEVSYSVFEPRVSTSHLHANKYQSHLIYKAPC